MTIPKTILDKAVAWLEADPEHRVGMLTVSGDAHICVGIVQADGDWLKVVDEPSRTECYVSGSYIVEMALIPEVEGDTGFIARDRA